MKKKAYQKPDMQKVELNHRTTILNSTSPTAISEVSTNTEYSRESSNWGDDD